MINLKRNALINMAQSNLSNRAETNPINTARFANKPIPVTAVPVRFPTRFVLVAHLIRWWTNRVQESNGSVSTSASGDFKNLTEV